MFLNKTLSQNVLRLKIESGFEGGADVVSKPFRR